MTVCVAFDAGGAAGAENEVVVEDLPTGEPVFRASNRDGGNGREAKVWQAVNDTDQPKTYRIEARHKDGRLDPADPWVSCPDKLLFASPVARVIGYEGGRNEDAAGALATVVWH
jgi:hypothetical protein